MTADVGTITERQERCAPVAVPHDLAQLVAGRTWSRDLIGQSGGAVYRLSGAAGTPDYYLKHGRDTVATDVIDEFVRLRWLGDYLPVPAPVYFSTTPDDAWLLTTAIPGRTAYDLLQERPDQVDDIVDAITDFLLRLHAVPVTACPYLSHHPLRLEHARTRIDAGLVDEDDFDDERAGWTAGQVWAAMTSLLPIAAESVVTHGDYSLDNIVLENGQVTGCIDLGRVGLADRYQDVAILWNALGEFGEQAQARMVKRYGLEPLDERRLNFHLMLDELF